MKRICNDLSVIEGVGAANVFCIGNHKEFTLVDTGIFMKTKYLITDLINNGYDLKQLKLIILTHCHCDHIGGVKELLENSDAKVAAHKKDIPYILQKSIIDGPYKKMMIEEQKAMSRLNCVVPRVDIELEDDLEIDNLTVINVPGHTPGSISLYQSERRWMFFGDVIRESKKNGLSIGKPEKFNFDTQQVRKDAERLLSYDIEYALLSHGKTYIGKEVNQLRDL
jgi:hydroxyacylglutathione hydrolase